MRSNYAKIASIFLMGWDGGCQSTGVFQPHAFSCQPPNSTQLTFNCRWGFHENYFYTTTTKELYSRSVEINGSVNQPNLRQLPNPILDKYCRQSWTTILDLKIMTP